MIVNLYKGDNVNRLHSKVIDTIPYIFKYELLTIKTTNIMTTKDLTQLQEETINCNLKAFNKYNKQHYTLKGINDFMANIASQKDASLYFPISACVHHVGKVYSVFITRPVQLK